MRDLISRSETGWAEGKNGGLIPVTRVKRIPANKYSKTYMDMKALVEKNNKEGKLTKTKADGTGIPERAKAFMENLKQNDQPTEEKKA